MTEEREDPRQTRMAGWLRWRPRTEEVWGGSWWWQPWMLLAWGACEPFAGAVGSAALDLEALGSETGIWWWLCLRLFDLLRDVATEGEGLAGTLAAAAPLGPCGASVCFFSLPPSPPSHLTLPFWPSLSCVILGNLETRPHVFNLQNYTLQWAGKGLSGIILLKICGFSPWNDLPEIIPFLSL